MEPAVTIRRRENRNRGENSTRFDAPAKRRHLGLAMAFKLDPALPLPTELARVLRKQLATAIELVRDRRIPALTRIHEGRTAGKKVRAALKLVRMRNPGVYRRANRRIRDGARALSAARDSDVLLNTFASVLKHEAKTARPAQFAGIRRAVRAHRTDTALGKSEIEARLRRYAAALRTTAQKLRTWEPRGDFADLADDFRRSYRRARRAFTQLHKATKPKAEAFHEWRKAHKAYSHHCRLLRAAWPAAMRERLDELRGMSRLLGDEHDLTVLLDTLRQLAATRAPGLREEEVAIVLKLIKTRRAALRTEALTLGARLYVDKPRAVKARLVNGWSVARREARAQ